VPRSEAGTAARVACMSAFGAAAGASVSAKLIADSSAVTAAAISAVGAGAWSYPATWAARSSAVKMLSASRYLVYSLLLLLAIAKSPRDVCKLPQALRVS
jgi:hypothetical protein